MRLTLLRAKEAVASRCPAEKLDYRINRYCERILNHRKFVGSTERIAIRAPYGQLTLPRQYVSVLGVKVNGFNYDLGNQWYEFLPGNSDVGGYTLNAVRDLGDNWAIMYTPRISDDTPFDPTVPVNDIPVGGWITVDYTGITTEVVTIYGRDDEGMPVNLVFNGKETKVNPFARIERIHKEFSPVPVRITYEATNNIETLLALMEPDEEETAYHRYIVDAQACREGNAIGALCKRRHIEFTRDTDILPFGNISALEAGMDALQYEAENDKPLANSYWETALILLNEELGSTNTSTSFPKIRFKYAPGTTPNLTSHY